MKSRLFGMALVLAALALPSAAKASQINFLYNTSFSNSTVPGAAGPWMNVNINDATAAAGYDVRVTIDFFGLTGSEFVSGVYLSVDPIKFPTALSPGFAINVTRNDNSALSGFSTGPDGFQADGDGKYDFLVSFNTNAGNRATDGTQYIFDIGTTGTLFAQDFNKLAAPGGGNGPFFAAAHLQGIGLNGQDSTWLADATPPTGDCPGCSGTPTIIDPVPEPATMFLFGSGLLGFAAKIRRKKAVA